MTQSNLMLFFSIIQFKKYHLKYKSYYSRNDNKNADHNPNALTFRYNIY
jgi:hypothetical protein